MNANQNSYFVHYGDFRMQDWLLKADLSPGAKLTYSVLACCASGRDHAWPTQEYLAEKVSASVRSVQRYLKELVEFGLIEKARRWIKGQMRCVYRFLVHKLIESSALRDKLSPSSTQGPENQAADTTICQKSDDILSPSLNKEETNKGKEILPPSPQVDGLPDQDPAQQVDDSGKAGEFLFGVTEDPEWSAIKKTVSAKLSESNFKTWIVPLIFERNGDQAVLRGSNSFFNNWILKNFKTELSEALSESGFADWRLELQTEEQQARQKKPERQASPPPQNQMRAEDLSSLSTAEQYQFFYKAYPKAEKHDRGFKVFKQMAGRKELPPVAELVKIIKRQYSSNPSWQRDQGRYIPQIHNWLSEKRWKD